MPETLKNFEIAPNVRFDSDAPVLIAGPCAVEGEAITMRIAERVKVITSSLGIPFVFKASFDKANRTSASSFRSIGFDVALKILDKVKRELDLPVLTDIHEPSQAAPVAEVVDILQIPAFLCRQTDLLLAAAKTGRPVNIKRGQFMAPEDMQYAVEKITSAGNKRAFLTERGASFGYHNLVVDMRAFPVMRQFAPVVFDATHSVQQPGGLKGASGGNREFIPYLARAAAGAGIDGLFVETHPDPSSALSDGPNMIPLDQLSNFLEGVKAVWQANKTYLKQLTE